MEKRPANKCKPREEYEKTPSMIDCAILQV